MILARRESAARALYNDERIEVVYAFLMVGNDMLGIQAVVILVLMAPALIGIIPNLNNVLESLLIDTLEGRDGDIYNFGDFQLVVIVAAIASLVVRD